MGKLKLAEMVLLAVAALVSAVKGAIKFIEYMIKLNVKPAINMV